MSTRSSPHPYHHGNLRRALLDSAIDLVREHGVEGLTLREVARRAGVSHAAPYHHFSDKSALVAALAVDGFERFTAALSRARDDAPGRHLAKIRALGRAYVRFALDEPDRFTLMWRPELRGGNEADVDAAGLRSYRVLIEEVELGQRAGEIRAGDPEDLSLAAWSAVHGLAMIVIDGPLRPQVTTWPTVEPLVEPVLRTVVRGLRPDRPTRPARGR